MSRPKRPRRLRFQPDTRYFKPVGVPLRTLEEVALFPDELEAIKLHDIDNLNQTNAAKKMNISQPTFARIIDKAYKKIAKALIHGQAIKLKEID